MQAPAIGNHGRRVMGHGVDVVDIAEFSRLLSDSALPFLNRYFNVSELAASGRGTTQVEKLASRFAVKEAVLKALGVGWGDGVAFTDVEVTTLPNGALSVKLHRDLLEIGNERGVVGWALSTSHTGTVAFASVIALGY